jgi:glyceraldehyde 3-phosphate dehydrogenase
MPSCGYPRSGQNRSGALNILLDADGLDLVGINDIADADKPGIPTEVRHRLRALSPPEVSAAEVVDGRRIPALAERDPAKLPWEELGVDLVLEAPGVFTTAEDLERHIQAGSSCVILSAPTKSDTVPTVVHGVNRPDGKSQIISCASCTTNCITPVIEVAHPRLEVERAIMTTVHAYTAGQQLVDGPARTSGVAGQARPTWFPTATGAAQPLAQCRSSPGGSTGPRSVHPSWWARSRTSSSLRAGRPRPKRSTRRSAKRPRPSAT